MVGALGPGAPLEPFDERRECSSRTGRGGRCGTPSGRRRRPRTCRSAMSPMECTQPRGCGLPCARSSTVISTPAGWIGPTSPRRGRPSPRSIEKSCGRRAGSSSAPHRCRAVALDRGSFASWRGAVVRGSSRVGIRRGESHDRLRPQDRIVQAAPSAWPGPAAGHGASPWSTADPGAAGRQGAPEGRGRQERRAEPLRAEERADQLAAASPFSRTTTSSWPLNSSPGAMCGSTCRALRSRRAAPAG